MYSFGLVNFKDNTASSEYIFSAQILKTNKLDAKGYPLNIELIFSLGDVANEMTWYSLNTIQLYSNTTVLDQNTVITQVVDSINNISPNMTVNELISTSQIINSLGTVDSNIGSLTNQTVNQTNFDTKFAVSTDGTVKAVNNIQCDDNYCSNQGKCSFVDNYQTVPICTCNAGFSGTYCNLNTQNQVIIKNFTINLITAIQTKLLSDQPTTSTGTTSNNIVVTPTILNSVNSQIEQAVKVLETPQEIQVFSNVVSLMLDSSSETSQQNVINSSTSILNMIKNFLQFNNMQIMKTKSQTSSRLGTSARLLLSKELRYLQQTTNSTNPTNATIQAPTLSNEDIANINKQAILSNENTKSLIFKFVKNYINYFSTLYNKDLVSNPTFANSSGYLKSVNVSQFSIDQSNNNFDLLFSPILDPKTFSFSAFFANRINNKQSYIDPQDCIINFLQSFSFVNTERTTSKVINNVAFVAYLNFRNPIYIIDNNLLSKSVSQSHSMIIFDVLGNQQTIDNCPNEILHNFILSPRSSAFIDRYNINPNKYSIDPASNITDISQKYSASYMPIYIYPNGTIDKSNQTNQIEKYYLTYRFSNLEYNVKNLTVYNKTLNIAKMYDDSNKLNTVKYINNGVIVASSRNLGEFTVMATYDPPTQPEDKYYFLRNGNIFRDGENWRNNSCMYLLVCLFLLNSFFVTLLMIFGCCHPESKDNTSYDMYLLKLENTNYLEDNQRFDNEFARYNLHGYLQSNENIKKKIEMNFVPVKTDRKDTEAAINLNGIKLEIPNTEAAYDKNQVATTIITSAEPSACNMFFFMFKRNIYAAPWVFDSPFSPKWKIMQKVFCLVYMLLFISSVLFIWSSIQLTTEVNTDYKSLVYVTFTSALAANFVFTLINLLYSVYIHNFTISECLKKTPLDL